MLDTIDQKNFLKNFFKDYERTHRKGFRSLFGNNVDEVIDDLTEKLIYVMKDNPKFFTYVCNGEIFIDKDEVRIPVHESTTLLAMISYFRNKACEIQRETNIFGVIPEHLQGIIGALQTKYDEMKAKEEEEEERTRLIEFEKKEREEYERLKKKYGDK
jgi:hypothetical protein